MSINTVDQTILEPDTAVLIHGRHTQAIGWEEMMWGDPESDKLGSAPTAVLSILDEGPERVKLVTIGSGASKTEGGVVEAQAIRDLTLERFDELDQFSLIREHPRWPKGQQLIRKLIEKSTLDVESQNTQQEVARAAGLFALQGVTEVIEVTGASHAPRCQSVQGVARESGVIPHEQRWRLVADDIPYPGSSVSDTKIFEPPHRADDPVVNWPEGISPASIFGMLHGRVPAGKRLEFIRDVAAAAQDASIPETPPAFEHQKMIDIFGHTPTIRALRDEGYETITFGRGPWIDGGKVVGMFSMFHPDGRVTALVTHKFYTDSGTTMRSDLLAEEFPGLEAYQEYVKERQIVSSKPTAIELIDLSAQHTGEPIKPVESKIEYIQLTKREQLQFFTKDLLHELAFGGFRDSRNNRRNHRFDQEYEEVKMMVSSDPRTRQLVELPAQHRGEAIIPIELKSEHVPLTYQEYLESRRSAAIDPKTIESVESRAKHAGETIDPVESRINLSQPEPIRRGIFQKVIGGWRDRQKDKRMNRYYRSAIEYYRLNE